MVFSRETRRKSENPRLFSRKKENDFPSLYFNEREPSILPQALRM